MSTPRTIDVTDGSYGFGSRQAGLPEPTHDYTSPPITWLERRELAKIIPDDQIDLAISKYGCPKPYLRMPVKENRMSIIIRHPFALDPDRPRPMWSKVEIDAWRADIRRFVLTLK
jgi:hypothetical protein